MKHHMIRRTISGSDSPTSQQLNTEADIFEQAAPNEISKLPSVKGEPTQ
ncbi:hypothetical protein KQ939_10995 [Planococcus sp. CP5-4]|nr:MULTISPECIES: hypothetical protein [unclassified Planococcus (in: firmicutes)]MBU9672457.1 hypothetical protein [Planococcus sp. CP5-4_YE]MBW6064237.1 hypothetical protein [Planococcus sp. CP5-4]